MIPRDKPISNEIGAFPMFSLAERKQAVPNNAIKVNPEISDWIFSFLLQSETGVPSVTTEPLSALEGIGEFIACPKRCLKDY